MPSWPRCGASTAWRWPDAGLLITLLCIDILTRIPKHAASAGVAKCKSRRLHQSQYPRPSRRRVSLEAQRAKIRAWCELNDAELVAVFEDAGLSGASMKGRKVLRLR